MHTLFAVEQMGITDTVFADITLLGFAVYPLMSCPAYAQAWAYSFPTTKTAHLLISKRDFQHLKDISHPVIDGKGV